MRDVEVRRHVAAPVERVWAPATDLEGAPRVVRGMEAVEVLTSGPSGVGTRWWETRRVFGRTEAAGRATIETHVSRVLATPGLRGRAPAVASAYESGLIRPGR